MIFFKSKLRQEYEQLKAKVAIKLGEREALLTAKDNIVIISDPDGHIRKVNKKCLQVLGYSEKELYDMNYWTMIHPEDLKKTEDLITNTVTTKEPVYDFICRVAHKSGKWVKMKFHTQTGKEGILYTKAELMT